MTNVASVGVKFDGADLERGIRALDALAARGPAVESALSRVEGAAARTGRTLATLGQTGDLSGVNRQSDSAAAGINRLGQAAAQASASVSGLGAASNSAQNGLSRTAQGAASSAEAMRSAATSANVLSSAMSSIAAGFGAAQLIGITDGYTKFTAQIRMATTGATDYANAMASVKAISTTAQADIGAIGVLYARIASATGALGISQKQLADITATVGLSLKASGATASESASAMLQLSQAFGAGALRGEEFNAVNEAAPGLLKVLAESMGKTSGELKKMAENGLLTSAAMAKAFSDPAVVADMQKKAAEVQTISGAFVVLKNEVMGFVGVSAQSSGAVKALTGGIESLAKNLDVLAAIGLTVTAVKLANWMSAGIAATYSQVAANRALLAANLATAQSEAASTGVTAAKTAARLAEVRAAALAAGGNLTLAVTLNGVIPAQAAATAAATAHTTALGALSVAQRAASASSALVGGALALLGGPIGAIVTVLGLGATAWYMWGKSAEDGSKQAAGAVKATSAEILANLDKQIEKSERRLELARQGNVELAKSPTQESEGAADALAEINRLKALGKNITGEQSLELIHQQGIYDGIDRKVKRLAASEAARGVIGSQTKSETWMAKYATDAEKMAAELKKARSELAAGSNELAEVEKRITAQYAAKAKGASGAAAAVKKEQSEYDKLVASIKTKIAQNDEEVKTGGKLNDAEKLRIKLQAEIEAGTRKSTAAHQANAKALLEALDASEQTLVIAREQKKFEGERDKEAQAIADEIIKINEKTVALQDEAEAYGKTAVELQALTIARLEDKAAMLASFDSSASDAEIAAIRQRIQALKQQGEAAAELAGIKLGSTTDETLRNAQEMARLYQSEVSMAGMTASQRKLVAEQRKIELDYAKKLADVDKSGALEEKKAQERATLNQAKQIELGVAAAQAQDEAWSGMWASVDSTAHDVFVNVADQGMDAFKRIGQTLKSAVLDMLYQMTIKKWIVSIGASVGGMGGMAQAAGSATGGGGASMANNASSMFSSSMFTDFGTGIGSSLNSAGGKLFDMGMEKAGTSMMDFGNAAYKYSETINMAGDVLGYAKAVYDLSQGKYGSAIGTAVGTYFGGPIGAAIGGWVGGKLDEAFGTRGANHGGGIYSSAGLSNQDAAQSIAGNLGWKGPVTDFTTRGNAALSGTVKTAVDSLLEMYAGLGALAKGAVTDLEVVAGFATNGKYDDEDVFGYFKIFDKLTGDLLNEYSNRKMGKDGDAAWAQYVADLGGAMVSQLLSADIPSWMATVLNELGEAPTVEALTGAVAKIHTIDAAFGTFSATIDGFAGLTDKAREALMLAAGGIEGLSSSLGSYYAEYYSDAERLAHSTKAVGDVFADMGIAVPTTRAGLRKLIEEQLALGESGAKTAAELLKVAPAFAEVTKGAEAAQKQLLESVGINSADIATTIRDSMLGRIDGSEAGQKIAGMVTDGIYNAIAGGFANQITDLMTTSIITPVIQAAITGASITEAVSQGTIDNMVAQAQAAAAALGQVLNNPEFKAAINSIGAAISGAVGGGVVGNSAGAGSSDSSFGGGSAGSYMPPEFQAFGTLASETIESNKKVSELLQKLLNPEKLFENRYKELDSRLEDKRNSNVSVAVSGGSSYATTLPDLLHYIGDMQAKISNKAEIWTIIDPIVKSIRLAESSNYEPDASAFKELAKMAVAVGGVTVDDAGYTRTSTGSSFGRVGEGSLEDATEKFLKDISATGGDITLWLDSLLGTGIHPVALQQLPARIAAAKQLEGELREWYLAQARVIAVEDMSSLAGETRDALLKTAELKRTGGLEDPIAKLKNSFAQKFTAIDEGINTVLNAEIAARSADANDAKALMEKYQLGGLWHMSGEERAKARHLFGDNIGRNMYKDEAQYMRDVIAQIEDGIAAITAEQQTYIDGLNDWYKAQAELLSTEMLVDINQQIKALEAQEKGPLTTIKEAIQKYIDDLTALGNLDATAQAAIDKLSGLQLTAGRKALYDQLLSPEELKTRSSYDLNVQFAGLGQAMPATTEALRGMIDAARAAGNITLADSLLELVPAFVSLQGAVDGVGDVLGNLRTATDDAYAALERAAGVQRDLLNETITHLQAVFDMTRDAARALYGEVESASQQSAAAGRAFIDNALANAQATGYMPDSDALREAIEGVRKGITAQQGASTFEAERDRLVLAGKLTDLKDIAEPQLTEAQRQLAALEEMLKAERTQIDELRGINTSVLSVADAMAALAGAMAAEKVVTPSVGGGGGSGSGSASGSSINDIYQRLFGRDAETAGADYWAGTGLTGSALETAIRNGALGDDKLRTPASSIAASGDSSDSDLSLNDWGQQLLDKNASVYASDKFKSASEDQITALKSGSTGGNIYLTADAALAALKAADPSELTAAGMVQRELTLAKGSGLSMDDRTDYAYGKISAEDLLKKYDIPGFATGINVVPYDMTARIHEGEAVVPARFNPFNPNAKGNGLGGTERLEALVEGLTAEVQRLQSIVAKGVEHQRETAEILDNVTEGGNAMRSEVVA